MLRKNIYVRSTKTTSLIKHIEVFQWMGATSRSHLCCEGCTGTYLVLRIIPWEHMDHKLTNCCAKSMYVYI